MKSKELLFLFQLFIILLIISLINTHENQKVAETKTDSNNLDKIITEENKNTNSKINTKIKFINCDKFCSKFEPTCPEIYTEVIKLSTEYILQNNFYIY